MVTVNFILRMVIFYREFSSKVDVKAKADLLNRMEVIMMEILKIMSPTDMEFMSEKKDLGMKDNGKIMFQMEMEKQHIQTNQDI
jgi:hypothetical protein